MSTVISVEHVSKSYRLGAIGGATLKEDFARWWAKRRGKPDPLLRVGEEHHARHMGDEFWALQDVNFRVEEGEVLGVIGRNGAGKSTLLKILSQVTSPTSGEIKIKGRIASLLEVGTGFHPELTGRENVFLNGAILGMTKAEVRKKFDEIIAFSGIEEFIDTPVKRYSSGMYVRLAFAVAAHLEPEILIVDEVLAVGDAEFQKKCVGKMNNAAQSGRTILFVSHQMEALQTLCQRCVYLRNGAVQGVGDSASLIKEYLSGHDQDKTAWTQRVPDNARPITITGFKTLGNRGQTPVLTGEPCQFIMEAKACKEIASLRVAFGIDDKFGRRLFTLDSYKYDIAYQVKEGLNRFVCHVDNLPLKSDTYRVHLYVGNAYEALDYVNGDAEMIVGVNNFYPKPNQDESHGSIYLAQDWQNLERAEV